MSAIPGWPRGRTHRFATAISFALRYGVPPRFLVNKFSHVHLEPRGCSGDRWMGARFLGPEYAVTEAGETPKLRPTEPDPHQKLPFAPVSDDAPLCSECGSVMTRNGSCYNYENCGGSSGCS